MTVWESNCNGLIVLIISGILLAAYGVQLFGHEQPCPLCMLQRLGMLGVASGALLNMRFGIYMSHYALMLFSSLVGGLVALRQISLHICPGFSTYGLPVLGLSLYTWSFIIFVCCILAVACLLLLYRPQAPDQTSIVFNRWCQVAFLLIFCLTLANALTTFLQCGWGPCQD